MPKILGIDTSSKRLGWCVWEDGKVLDHGMVMLRRDGEPLSKACRIARATVATVILSGGHHDVDAVAFEGAASRHAASLIAQSEVRGSVRGLVASLDILDLDVTPQAVKKALGCPGNATKKAVIESAAQYLIPDQQAVVVCLRGEHWMMRPQAGGLERLYSEDEADALGVCMAAAKIVKVVPV